MIALPDRLVRTLRERGRGLSVVVVRLGAMGDVLRTIPPVRLLRSALPEATIHWVVEEPWPVLLAGHPDLDGVIPAPRGAWRAMLGSVRGWKELPGSLGRFRAALRAPRARLAIDFHGNLRSGLIARGSGAPVRLGFAGHEQKEGNRWFTTHRVPSGERRTPRMERNLSLLAALGLPTAPLPGGALPLVAAGEDAASRVLRSLPRCDDGFAVLSPGASASQAYKRPPADLLAAACEALDRRSVVPLVAWGPGEEDHALSVVERLPGRAVLAPPTGLPALAALLARARLFVGGDTGPLHMACAVGCPVVGIYGPTDPRVNRPWGVPFRVVAPPGRDYTGIKRIDRDSGGFAGVEPTVVEQAVAELLDRPS